MTIFTESVYNTIPYISCVFWCFLLLRKANYHPNMIIINVKEIQKCTSAISTQIFCVKNKTVAVTVMHPKRQFYAKSVYDTISHLSFLLLCFQV